MAKKEKPENSENLNTPLLEEIRGKKKKKPKAAVKEKPVKKEKHAKNEKPAPKDKTSKKDKLSKSEQRPKAEASTTKQKPDKKEKSKRKTFLLAFSKKALLPAMLLFILFLTVFILLAQRYTKSPTIAQGILIEGIPVTATDKDTLTAFVQKQWPQPTGQTEIVLYAGEWQKAVRFDDLSVQVDSTQLVNDVLAKGNTGRFLNRLSERIALVRKGTDVTVPISFSHDKMDTLLQEVYERLHRKTSSAQLFVSDTKATLTAGSDGVYLNTNRLAADIINLLGTRQGGRLFVPTDPVRPPAIAAETVIKAIEQKAENAKSLTDADGNTTVVPSKTGRHIDIDILTEEINKLENRTDRSVVTRALPVTFTEPEVTTQSLQRSTDQQIGGIFQTIIPEIGNAVENRTKNIRLAVQALNGTIVPSMGHFSFNDVTGPRSHSAGYLPAPVYENGAVATGIGGGVCQVSSTLFNAMLLAGLTPEERHPHMFPVAYVAPGRDASVSYGTQDLQFANPYPSPVQILADTTDNVLTVKVLLDASVHKKGIRLFTKWVGTSIKTSVFFATTALDSAIEREPAGLNTQLLVETWYQSFSGENLIEEWRLFTSRYQPLPAPQAHLGYPSIKKSFQ